MRSLLAALLLGCGSPPTLDVRTEPCTLVDVTTRGPGGGGPNTDPRKLGEGHAVLHFCDFVVATDWAYFQALRGTNETYASCDVAIGTPGTLTYALWDTGDLRVLSVKFEGEGR